MKVILRWFLPVAILWIAAGCSKERTLPTRLEFDAEWAAACYFGPDAQGSVDQYQLDLAQGRTDEDLTLISSGAVARLMLSAPVAEVIAFPNGHFFGSSHGEAPYTFDYGEVQEDKSIAGSYIGFCPKADQQVQLYPIEHGEVSVSIDDNGEYRIRVEVLAAQKTFVFEYRGEVPTADCS
ncbi:MAG: hypothetical protein K5849_04315 [Bacteroidales bacterium]|nr:hypothetical protein [Bacteroidales bacterium]